MNGKPRTPPVTVDVIIELADRRGRPVVLVERKNPPYGLALPGGFVDCGETLLQAAVREAAEETGLSVEIRYLLGCYSAPDRDPRGQTVSVVFVAVAHGEPEAGDDAADVAIHDPAQLPELVFDHAQILNDYIQLRDKGLTTRAFAR